MRILKPVIYDGENHKNYISQKFVCISYSFVYKYRKVNILGTYDNTINTLLFLCIYFILFIVSFTNPYFCSWNRFYYTRTKAKYSDIIL